jgi:hypothetical protein
MIFVTAECKNGSYGEWRALDEGCVRHGGTCLSRFSGKH